MADDTLLPQFITGIIGFVGGLIGGYVTFRIEQEKRLVNLERDIRELKPVMDIMKKIGTDQLEVALKRRRS